LNTEEKTEKQKKARTCARGLLAVHKIACSPRAFGLLAVFEEAPTFFANLVAFFRLEEKPFFEFETISGHNPCGKKHTK
jgi:hypothetical protein